MDESSASLHCDGDRCMSQKAFCMGLLQSCRHVITIIIIIIITIIIITLLKQSIIRHPENMA